MEQIIKNLVSFTLHFFLVLSTYFTKIIHNERSDLEKISEVPCDPPKTKPKHTMNYKRTRKTKSTSNLLFNTRNSILNLSDLITPVEEEMLRCLCAKGYTKHHRMKKLCAKSESCISRDTFTNIWIDSCCSV